MFNSKNFYFLIYLFLFVQSITGKSVGLLEDGYQEIEDESNTPIEKGPELIEIGDLPDNILREICESFRVTLYEKNTNSVIHCPDFLNEESKNIRMVKRETELEGSGDVETQTEITENPEEREVSKTPTTESSTEKEEAVKETVVSETPAIQKSSENESNKPEITTLSAPPTLFKVGFDHILKNLPTSTLKLNTTLEEGELTEILNGKRKKVMLTVENSPIGAANEIVKAGESQENPSAASANNTFLIVFAVICIIGTLAFAYNFIRKRKENKEIDEVIELEKEGQELKEMKPLMKNPLVQNGAKSLEYIDADIQDSNEIQVEINERKENGKEP